MDWQDEAHILCNDLDSARLKIERMPAHPKMTEAQNLLQQAEEALRAAWGELHQREIRQRYDV